MWDKADRLLLLPAVSMKLRCPRIADLQVSYNKHSILCLGRSNTAFGIVICSLNYPRKWLKELKHVLYFRHQIGTCFFEKPVVLAWWC